MIDFMFFGATEASEKSFRLLRGYPLVAAAAAVTHMAPGGRRARYDGGLIDATSPMRRSMP